ncbi:MAG TPA: hypothetical protein VL049_11645 [Candidatus Dormibacteraeota bacterium]|nr:hypothetical protein [Candidatus Dormibacteraeota bacterium]
MTRALLAAALVAILALPAPALACPGDCNGDGAVSIDELVRGVGIALGSTGLGSCPAFDSGADGTVSIDELIAAVNAALGGCANVTPTATEPLPEDTATPTATPGDGGLSLADAVARDADGVAIHLGERITTEGVVTVDAATFANSKLKVFIQEGGVGLLVYHQTSANVDAFAIGQRLRVTGVVGQFDPTGGADNRGEGTVLVDLTNGSWTVLSNGNPVPDPVPLTLAQLAADGIARVGTLVRISGLRKVGGDWPKVGDRSTQVTVGDASGGPHLPMRFQRLTITPALASKLATIGDGAFDATVIVVQDDPNPDDGLHEGFELWPRGAEDLN